MANRATTLQLLAHRYTGYHDDDPTAGLKADIARYGFADQTAALYYDADPTVAVVATIVSDQGRYDHKRHLTLDLPAPALIASVSADGNLSTAIDTTPIDTRGAKLLIACAAHVGTTAVVVDGLNTWTQLVVPGHETTADHHLYYCVNPVTSAAHSFHVEIGFAMSVVVAAFSGVRVYNADLTGTGSASASSLQPGSLTPPSGFSLLVSGFSTNNNTGVADAAIDSGFTIIGNQPAQASSNAGSALAYLVQTSAAAVNPTWSQP